MAYNTGFSTATLAQVATILAQEYGVRVQLGGRVASTTKDRKGKWVINIPSLATNAPAYMDIMRGYLDHEAGHVRFSDMRLLSKHCHKSNYMLRSIWNSFEDVYVERRMAKAFPGCARNLRICAERLFSGYEGDGDPVVVLLDYILYKSRYESTKSKVFEAPLAYLASELRPELKALVDTYVARLPKCKGTKDNMKLAQLLLADLQRFIEEQAPDPSDVSGDGDGSGAGSCYGDNDGDPQHGTDTTDEDSDGRNGCQGSGSGGSKSRGGSNKPEDEGEGEGDQQQSESGNGQDGGQQQGDELGDIPEDTNGAGGGGAAPRSLFDEDKFTSMLESLLSAMHEDGDADESGRKSYDVQDRVNEALNKQLSEDEEGCGNELCTREAWRIFKRMKDIDSENIKRCFAPLTRDKLNAALKESAKLSSQLSGLLQAMIMNRGGAARRGQIDSRRLARVVTGRSDIFSSRVEKLGLDTEVVIAVDISGSMDGYDWGAPRNNRKTKLEVANAATFSLLRALKGIPGVRSMAFVYSQFVAHIANFDENFSERSPMCNSANGGTPTGEALQHALTIFTPHAKRRLLFIITDGSPDSNEYFKMTLRMLKRQGIECIGVGVLDDCITEDMDENECCVIKELDELAPSLFRLLREKLVRIA